MNYEEFKEQFVENLKESLYERGFEDVQMREAHVDKINGGYDAVTITPDGSNIGATLNIDNFYKAFEDGADMSEVVTKATDVVIEGIENTPVIDVAALTDYDQMKDKLVMEVVSAETNAEMLKNVPHQNMEDMAVVYRFVLDSNENGRASILATNNMIEAMGVTPEQLHADAMENAPQLRPAQITGMSEVIAEMMGIETAEMMGIVPVDPKDEQMFVATVSDKVMGAGVLAYQNFMDEAAERVGGSFFVLPSSRHEVLLVPDNGQIQLPELEAMVREVNATQVAPEDKLTDNVYHYDAEAKIFELGEKFVNRGFTHYCSRGRNGMFRVKRKTSRKKFTKKCKEINRLICDMRHLGLKEIMKKINQILVGYYHYYGITDNLRWLYRFRDEVQKSLFRWLNRRSQRRSYNWKQFQDMLKAYPIARPKIYVHIYAK